MYGADTEDAICPSPRRAACGTPPCCRCRRGRARPSGSEASYLNGCDSFYNACLYSDRDGDGLVGNDDPTNARNEFIGYVHYGWYCFNANHNESNCPYRGYGDHNSGYSPAHQH